MSEEPTRRNNDALREILDNLDELEFGIITQRGYKKLEKKIEDHAESVEARFTRWFTKGLVAFAVMGLICAISLVGFGILLVKQGDLTQEIQTQRFNASLDACEDQNKRHDNVIQKTNEAVAEAPNPEQAEKSSGPFKLILEAAVPYTDDCVALSHSRVEGETP